MLLRNFKALTNTASKSLFTYPCTLTNMDGVLVSSSTSPVYLQIHDKASAPVADDIPIASYQVSGAVPTPLPSIFQSLGPIVLSNGLAVAISTVHQKYTAATATYDVFGQIEEGYQSTDSIPGLTTSGDLTTPTQGTVFWQDGADSNNTRLYRIRAKNLSAGTRYLMLFAADAFGSHPQNGDPPLSQWQIAAGVTLNLYFNGLKPYQFFNIAPASGKVYGCSVMLSSTPGTLTFVVGNDLAVEAQYKVVTTS